MARVPGSSARDIAAVSFWHRPLFGFYLPSALILLFAGAIVYGVIARAAAELDRFALENEHTMAETVTKSMVREMERVIGDYAVWDDAFDALNRDVPLPDWLANNISVTLNDSFGISASYVFRGDAAPLVSFTLPGFPDGLPHTPAIRNFVHTLQAIPADADSVARGGFLSVYGKIFLLIGARVVPITPDRKAEAEAAKPVVIVWARQLGADTFAELTGGLRFDGFSFVKNSTNSAGNIQLHGVDGASAGYFYWTPIAPGARMAAAIWPFALAAGLGVLFGFGILGRNWERVQKRLHVSYVQVIAAQEANRAKGIFLASMSHELRTPLNAIIGFSEVIQLEIFGRIEIAKYREYIGNIRDSGQHLLGVINDVLSLAKLESGHSSLTISEIDPEQIAGEAVAMLDLQARAKGLTLSLLRPRLALRTMGDATALRQILINLIGNAIKFTDFGSVNVIVDAGSLHECRISVEDSGPGIPADKLPFLSQPFFQVEDVYRRKNGGTGLGLSISRLLTEQMGGTFAISSKIGTGTCVTITLQQAGKLTAGKNAGDGRAAA